MKAYERGVFGSERIPIPAQDEIDAAYCLELLCQIRDVSFATVTEEGLPAVRIIDVMAVDDGKLYFLTARGKAFYDDLAASPYVAIVGMTTDFRMVRLEGRAEHPIDAAEQRCLVDWIFELNPDMGTLYEGDARYVLEVFYVECGTGEYYDLGQKPVVRVPYAIGEDGSKAPGARFRITKQCTGCATCAHACPQHCIKPTENASYTITQSACLSCGYCMEICPVNAIEKQNASHREQQAEASCGKFAMQKQSPLPPA